MDTGIEARDRELSHHVFLQMLGCTFLVRCAHAACRDGIKEHFSCHVVEPWCAPDVVVDCNWQQSSRYLFRARPDAQAGTRLQGVRVHVRGSATADDWSSLDPPLPPFNSDPIRDRFVGLHAAAVVTPNRKGAILLIGDRGAGKSTLSVLLTNEFDCSLLTDETVCIHRRTRVIEPLVIPIGFRNPLGDSQGKTLVQAELACREIATDPVAASHIIFLQPDGSEGCTITPITSAAAFRKSLDHQLDLGCRMDECLLTLAALARTTPAATLRYGSYQALRSCGKEVLHFCGLEQAIRV